MVGHCYGTPRISTGTENEQGFWHEFDVPKLKMDSALHTDLRYEIVVEESVSDCGDTKQYQRGDSEKKSPQVGSLCRFGGGSMDWNESCILSRSDHARRGVGSIGSVPLLSPRANEHQICRSLIYSFKSGYGFQRDVEYGIYIILKVPYQPMNFELPNDVVS